MVMVSRVRYQREMMADWARRRHWQPFSNERMCEGMFVLLCIPVCQAGVGTVRSDWLDMEQRYLQINARLRT